MQVRLVSLAVVLSCALATASCGSAPGDGDAACGASATGPGGVVGFDRATGEQRWTMPIGSPDGAVVVGDVLIVSTATEVVRGIAMTSGEVVWCTQFESEVKDGGGVVAAGPNVATLANGDVVALDPATGAERWRRNVGTPESLLRGGDVVWVSDGSAAGGILAALDAVTGQDVPIAPGPPLDTSFMRWAPQVSAGGFELTVAPGGGGGGLTQAVEVTVSSQGEGVWSQTVPGFVAAIVRSAAGPMVLVLDQTGGTGTMPDGGPVAGLGTAPPTRFDTRLTAYAASTGDQVWQVALPGTPHVIAPISDELVVVPNGTELHAVHLASGKEVWTVEMPSPGQGGSYSELGTFWFVAGGEGTAAVAVGFAEQPYRD